LAEQQSAEIASEREQSNSFPETGRKATKPTNKYAKARMGMTLTERPDSSKL